MAAIEKKKHTLPTIPILKVNDKNGVKTDIPIDGSLGLLALGDIGLISWRQRKLEAKAKLND